MSTSVKVLEHSVNPKNEEIVTFQVTCHRWILAEINTHRMLSRNWRSSRAVPVAKLIEEVKTNPAMPVEWRKNKPGMVAGDVMTEDEKIVAQTYWKAAAQDAIDNVESLLHSTNLHKQWANRLLEPFMWAHGVITATDWYNFYKLRCAKDAQPEFRLLATKMKDAHINSEPRRLNWGDWHLPYCTDHERDRHTTSMLLDLSAARCARVSYAVFNGQDSLMEENQRVKKLIKNKHMSPFEHQACAVEDIVYSNNLRGSWLQHRERLEYVLEP